MVKQKSHSNIIYSGEMVAGSLLISESRKIAQLLLAGVDETGWHQSIVIDNVIQKRSPVAAKRQARLIKNRLTSMGPELWQMVSKGANDVSVQALLSSAVKHSRLLGDFMESVVKKNWLTFTPKISTNDTPSWYAYHLKPVS